MERINAKEIDINKLTKLACQKGKSLTVDDIIFIAVKTQKVGEEMLPIGMKYSEKAMYMNGIMSFLENLLMLSIMENPSDLKEAQEILKKIRKTKGIKDMN